MMLSKLLVRGAHCIAQFTSDLASFLALFKWKLCVLKAPLGVLPVSDEAAVGTAGVVWLLTPEAVCTLFVEGLSELAVHVDLRKGLTLGLFVMKETALIRMLLGSVFGLSLRFLLPEGLLPLSLSSSWCT